MEIEWRQLKISTNFSIFNTYMGETFSFVEISNKLKT